MKSDIYIVKVSIQDGFEDEIKTISENQSLRDEPRKLVGCFEKNDNIILIYELV